MKRMNLIRAALFAVFAFMGTISLSAQTWLPPAAAAVVIANELDHLSEMPAIQSVGGLQTKQQMYAEHARVGCTDCLLNQVKKHFLSLTMVKLKQGATDTGAAVEEVRAFLISQSGGNATLLGAIQQGYQYMQDTL